jgi:hypothetical protein
MSRLISIVSLLLLFVTSIMAQEVKDRAKAVVIPSQIYLPTIVAQPDCPLMIEKAVIAKMLDGTRRDFFIGRNTGNKPIVFFQIAAWYSDNTGLNAIWPYKRTQIKVPPGAVAPSELSDGSIEFVPLTDSLRKHFRLNGKMRGVVFFMVLKVEFDDGSVYDATPLLRSLQEHLTMFEEKYEKPLSLPH